MKRLFICLLCCGLWGSIHAQTHDYHVLSASEQTVMLNQLSQSINTLQCQFVQEKHSTMLADVAVMKGTLSFVKPNKLRWQYTSPNAMAFVYSDGKAITLNANGEVQPQNNRMAQDMSRLIVGIISGESLNNTKQFKISSSQNDDQYKIQLQPTNSRLKSMMQDIELIVNRKTSVATVITIHEAGGDRTVITFSQPRINQKLSESLFQIK